MAVSALISACSVAAVASQPAGFTPFTDPGGHFSISFPAKWQWSYVTPSGEPLAIFVESKHEAAVVVERLRLKDRLLPKDINDEFANIEASHVKDHQPNASNVTAKLDTSGGRHLIVVDYTRPGIGERQRVRMYSFPIGQDLYRITCMAHVNVFPAYESTFVAVATSLKALNERVSQ